MTDSFRTWMEKRFEQFGRLIYRRPWITLFLVAALVAGLVSQLPKLTMDTSTEGFLHEEDTTLLEYNRFRAQFGRDELVVIAVQAEDVFDQAFLGRLRDMHRELAEKVPHLDDITSLVNARNTRGAEGELIVEDLLEHWPENESELAEIKERARNNPLYRDMLLSADGTITTVVIKTNAYAGDGGGIDDVVAVFDEGLQMPTADAAQAPEREFLTDQENSELVAAVRDIAQRYDAPGFKIHLAGSPVVSDVLKLAMQTNMKRFTLIALLMIALVLGLLFRRVSGVLLPLGVVVFTLLSTLGLMAIAGIPFKLPTQILPSFLLAVGVGASVHVLAIFYRHLQQTGDKEEAVGYSLGHSGLAIVMTSVTTAAGLASFAGAEVAPVGDLGLVAAIGVMISLVYTLILVPALLSVMPIKAKQGTNAEKRHARMDRLMTGIADFSTQKPKIVLAVSAAVLVFGLTGAVQVNFSHKPFEWLPKSDPTRQASDFIDARMKGASSVEVIVDAGRENGLHDPALLKGLEQLDKDVRNLKNGDAYVGKTTSPTDILKEINKALNENREDYYAVPGDRQLIAQEFLLFENSGSDDLEDFVDSRFQLARFTGKMPWADAVYLAGFVTDLETRFKETLGNGVAITVTGMNALLGRTMTATIHTMAESYVYAALVITLMMVLLIGNLRMGLVSMIPNLTPIILTLGVMGWFGLPLDLFTMLIGSIAIGLAVDDTIHFMHNYRRYYHQGGNLQEAVRKTLLTSGRAMLVTTVVLASGFFLYMFSTLSNIISFGILTGFTIIMALLADFFLAPALISQLHRSRLLPDKGDY